MTRSSSWHRLNADRRFAHRIWPIWFLANFVNNWSLKEIPGLKIKKFKPRALSESWVGSEITASPSRRLTDLFLAQLPYDQIAQTLGGIHLLDVGCGVGKYAGVFDELCKSVENFSYLGIDVKASEQWKTRSSDKCTFKDIAVDNISAKILTDVNVVVSVSVLEHLDEDLLLLEKITGFEKKLGKQFLQIHFVPSSICLWLYGLHGVRQYTPRTIKKISQVISNKSGLRVFALGGARSNWVHWRNITFPIKTRLGDRRFSNTKQYCQARDDAIALDKEQLGDRPSFYAILILPEVLSDLEL